MLFFFLYVCMCALQSWSLFEIYILIKTGHNSLWSQLQLVIRDVAVTKHNIYTQ